MSDNFSFMQADKTLTRDLEKASTPEEIRQLLENAVSRSGIADRDPVSGRFIPRTPQPATQSAQPVEEEHTFTKTETIGGREFEFTAASAEALEEMIAQAQAVAEAVKPVEQPTPGAFRQRMEDAGLQAMNEVELRLKFQRGEITVADYIEQSGALDQALAARGFDVDEAALHQYEKSWEQATQEFLNSSAGSTWPGGQRNLQVIGSTVIALGLQDSDDKVAALAQAFEHMKKNDLVFSVEPTQEQLEAETANMTPQEILMRWKESQGDDPEVANQSFIKLHSSSGSGSSLFGKS